MDNHDVQGLALVRDLAHSGQARLRRENARLSLSEIARTCGVDTATVWRWETGRRRPRGAPALRYLQLLELLKKGADDRASA